MPRVRVVPILLVRDGRLVKTTRFSNDVYLGDPTNAVRVFNEKDVDELLILDISSTTKDVAVVEVSTWAAEAFVPVTYGGHVRSVSAAEALVSGGVEKVLVNRGALERPTLVTEMSSSLGSQSVVVGVDVERSGSNWRLRFPTSDGVTDPLEWAKRVVDLGAGELVLQSVDRDGTRTGYEIDLLRQVSDAVPIPVTIAGGASGLDDFAAAAAAGASAVAAGSIFVFFGRLNGVLINCPSEEMLAGVLGKYEP